MGFKRQVPPRREEALLFRSQQIRVLRRPFQRTLRVQVKPTGEVLLTSGMTVSESALERFLNETWEWVEKIQARNQKLNEKFPPKRYIEGEEFLFLGIPRRLKFCLSESARMEVGLRDKELIAFVPPKLWPSFNPQADHPEWRQPSRRFFEYQGRLIIASRVDVFSKLMELKPSALKFRCQSTRWGSCNSLGKLSLNWRLIAAPIAVIDYVVIHELSHLKIMNHSHRFWDLVQTYCPNHQAQTKWLRENHLDLEFLKR